MFWADKVAQELKNNKSHHVDDMKTPSGKIHVGALRGVVVHDIAHEALQQAGVKSIYTYVFDDHDPMDGLPVYLPKEKFEKYLGMPLYKVPSPVEGFENYAKYYAHDFINVFTKIGCNPEILWSTKLYMSGKMNDSIKECLDKANVIRKIYEEIYKKELASDWYPFNVYCQNCGKVSTTKVHKWDGKNVYYRCNVDGIKWTKGCGYEGNVSPLSNKDHIAGKLPWKVEWAVKWKVIGVTVEGAGKDHMSQGGSHDLASLICERVINYPIPYPIAYEFFLIKGKKMSSSKGLGSTASEMLEILPPEILRFLMVKTDINQAINFDPYGQTIPKLFDEYQQYAESYFNDKKDDYARIFELSQVDKIKQPPTVRFSTLTQWVQMPNMNQKIKEEGLDEWVKYAKIWVEKYAPESDKFLVQERVPETAKNLTDEQKKYLQALVEKLEDVSDAEALQTTLYDLAKEIGLSPKDAFGAIYISLIGKPSGPKAGFLLMSLDKEFVKKRFSEISS